MLPLRFEPVKSDSLMPLDNPSSSFSSLGSLLAGPVASVKCAGSEDSDPLRERDVVADEPNAAEIMALGPPEEESHRNRPPSQSLDQWFKEVRVASVMSGGFSPRNVAANKLATYCDAQTLYRAKREAFS